jgi:hypothetical protein
MLYNHNNPAGAKGTGGVHGEISKRFLKMGHLALKQ